MKEISRSVEEWLLFFQNIMQLKETYGSKIFKETILALEQILEKRLPYLSCQTDLLNALYKFHIDDLSVALDFLKEIQNIYSFESIFNMIREHQLKRGITHISFLVNGVGKRKDIHTYCTNGSYRKVFCQQGIIPVEKPIFTSNGFYQTTVYDDSLFIVDEKNFVEQSGKRILYTCDFHLNCETLPEKEQMDVVAIQKNRNQLFDLLLDWALTLQLDHLSFSIEDPNRIYHYSVEESTQVTFNSDGELFNQYDEKLLPSQFFYHTSKIRIANSNFAFITRSDCGKVYAMQIIAHPDFIKDIFDSNDLNLKESIMALISKEKSLDSILKN